MTRKEFYTILSETKTKNLKSVGLELNQHFENGDTPLAHECSIGSVKGRIDLYLKNGADPNFTTKGGMHPLVCAMTAYSGERNEKPILKIAKKLLKYGMDVNYSDGKNSLLTEAAYYNFPKLCEFLIKNGADTEYKASKYELNALEMAQQSASADAAKALSKYFKEKSRPTMGSEDTSLSPETDVEFDSNEIPDAIEFDINRKDERGNTDLHYAAERGDITRAEIMIKSNADINAPNDSGSTPIFLAVAEGKKEMVSFLIENGADCSISRDFEIECNETTLFGGKASTKKVLEKETVLDYAIRLWEKDIVDILSAAKAPTIRKKALKIDLQVAKQIKKIWSSDEANHNPITAANIINSRQIPTFDGEDMWTWTKVARVLSLLDD